MFLVNKTKDRIIEKWNAIGNDFLITEDDFTKEEIIRICNRHFGIGADQFVTIKGNRIRFFNSDGSESGMCGNALKCVIEIASRGTKEEKLNFELLNFSVNAEVNNDGIPCIHLPIPISFKEEQNPFLNLDLLKNPLNRFFFVDIGNPHFISIIQEKILEKEFFSSSLVMQNLEKAGIYLQNQYIKTNGINVSFVIIKDKNNILVRTYERGVGETLSCGSGSVASAFSTAYLGLTDKSNIKVFNIGSEKVLAIHESYHQISIGLKGILFKGKGTRVAKIII